MHEENSSPGELPKLGMWGEGREVQLHPGAAPACVRVAHRQ